jgi:hypothetical protein
MKRITTPLISLILLLVTAGDGFAQDKTNQVAGKGQTGVMVERFRLKNGRTYEGIWDLQKPLIHVVNKTNHVADLPVATNEVVKREFVRDGSDITIFTPLQIAERTVTTQLDVLKAARVRVDQSNQYRKRLHATYHGKNLPTAQYNAVLKQYQAADDAVANAEKAAVATQAAFDKACQNYEQLGGRTNYRSLAQ